MFSYLPIWRLPCHLLIKGSYLASVSEDSTCHMGWVGAVDQFALTTFITMVMLLLLKNYILPKMVLLGMLDKKYGLVMKFLLMLKSPFLLFCRGSTDQRVQPGCRDGICWRTRSWACIFGNFDREAEGDVPCYQHFFCW